MFIVLYGDGKVSLGDPVRKFRRCGQYAFTDFSEYGVWVSSRLYQDGWEYLGTVEWSPQEGSEVVAYGMGMWEFPQFPQGWVYGDWAIKVTEPFMRKGGELCIQRQQ